MSQKWPRRQSSPSTGKLSARPAGKPGDLFVKGEFATIPSAAPSLSSCRIIPRRLGVRFFRQGGIYRSDVVQKQNQSQNLQNPRVRCRLPLVGPASLGQRRDGRSAPWLIVRDEFRTGYSSIGLLASRARLRFTGASRITWAPQRFRAKVTFLLCQGGDISILP